jgi:hypothetical protein
MYCSNGHPMTPGQNFCPICGAPPRSAAEEPVSPLYSPPPPKKPKRRMPFAIGGLTLLAIVGAVAISQNSTKTGTQTQPPTPTVSDTSTTDPCMVDGVNICDTSSTGNTAIDTTPVTPPMQIYYEVSVARSDNIDSVTYNDGNGNIQQDTTGRYYRWVSKTYTIAGDGSFFASVSGQNGGGGKIVCDVFRWSTSRNKWVVAQEGVSYGDYAICDASTDL